MDTGNPIIFYLVIELLFHHGKTGKEMKRDNTKQSGMSFTFNVRAAWISDRPVW
jgi:hypothetical protein